MWHMSIGAFVDKRHRPTTKEMLASIGSKRRLWEKLVEFVRDNYRVKDDMAFYGRNYGWAVRFRTGGRALLSMYPEKGDFTAQIVLSGASAKEASGLKLGKNVRSVLERAHEFPEGRWLFVKIESEQDLNDIHQLLVLKSHPSKKK
jgi:hypothetical protein